MAGVRGALSANPEASLDRLSGADTDVYDFSVERDRLAGMVADLRAGRDLRAGLADPACTSAGQRQGLTAEG